MNKLNYFWVKPLRANKHHIAGADGRTLCGNWLITNQDQVVLGSETMQIDDCKTCFNAYLKLKDFKVNETVIINEFPENSMNHKGRVDAINADGTIRVVNMNQPFCGTISQNFTPAELTKC